MTYPFAMVCQFITRTKTGTDGLGNPVYVDGASVSVPGCLLAPGGSTETLGNQDTTDDQPTLYVPNGAPVPTAIDVVVHPTAGRFEVDGSPDVWPATAGGYSIVVRLRQVTG